MRCKAHLSDTSSSIGVCSSCLRDRLFTLIAAQSQLPRSHSRAAVTDDPRKSDAPNQPQQQQQGQPPRPPQLMFPRSVSPYVARRKSDHSVWGPSHHPRFYSTPQVGPTFGSSTTTATSSFNKKRSSKFSFISSLFRSRSEKLDSDPRNSASESTSTSSPARFFSSVFTSWRKKEASNLSTTEFTDRRPCRNYDRGMSPVRDVECDLDCNDYDRCHSGCESDVVSPRWKRTPATARGNKAGYGKNVSGLAFCLSPLVRATPNRDWNGKCVLQSDGGYSGEIRLSKPNLQTASFCKNRSRKLVDFGRVNPNR